MHGFKGYGDTPSTAKEQPPQQSAELFLNLAVTCDCSFAARSHHYIFCEIARSCAYMNNMSDVQDHGLSH